MQSSLLYGQGSKPRRLWPKDSRKTQRRERPSPALANGPIKQDPEGQHLTAGLVTPAFLPLVLKLAGTEGVVKTSPLRLGLGVSRHQRHQQVDDFFNGEEPSCLRSELHAPSRRPCG